MKGFQSKLYSIFQKNFLIFKSFNISKEKRDAKVVSYEEYAQLELSHAFSFAKFASVVMEKNLFYIIFAEIPWLVTFLSGISLRQNLPDEAISCSIMSSKTSVKKCAL